MNKPKAIGTAAETAVVRFLRMNGFPHAERRALRGTTDAGDVSGCIGICWEVKGGTAAKTASDGQVAAWLVETETERRNASSDVGVLVMQRAGHGPANAGNWWAVVRYADLPMIRNAVGVVETESLDVVVRLRLADLVTLLRAAGYGRAPETSPTTTAPDGDAA